MLSHKHGAFGQCRMCAGDLQAMRCGLDNLHLSVCAPYLTTNSTSLLLAVPAA